MPKEKDTNKKDYSKIEPKDNMKVDNNGEEVSTEPEERGKPKQVLAKAPKKRKKGLMERLVVGFLGPDGLPGIGAYLNEEIIVPSIKNIIVEAVTSGINMAVFGDRGAPRTPTNYSKSSNRTVIRGDYRPDTDYRSMTSRYTSAQPSPTRRGPEVVRNIRHVVDDYTIENRMDANHVLTSLIEFADQYDYVSVADYYDIIGVSTSPNDHNYGWSFEGIAKATISPVRGGGYVINFPPVIEI